MKRIYLNLITGTILLFVMTGCPYESKVPLSDSCASGTDPELTGKWILPSSKKDKDTIEFLKFNEHEYYIVSHMKENGNTPKTMNGRAFITIVKGQKIINFSDLDKPDAFMFFKYQIINNKLITWSPSDQFIKQEFSSSKELLAFFNRNLDKKGFFETADTAFRATK
jgi:hypothetical protein